MNILVFAAHPDDEVIGVGGTLLKRKREGHTTAVCYFTKAVKEKNTPAQMRSKQLETESAGKALGVTQQYFLNFPAGQTDTLAKEETITAVKEVITKFQPDVIYTHYIYDLHSDHRVLAESVLIAGRPINFNFLREVYFYNEATAATFWALPPQTFKPNVFVDISNEIEGKMDAFKCYKSQTRVGPSVRTADFLRDVAQYHGRMVGVKFAEVFELVYHREIARR